MYIYTHKKRAALYGVRARPHFTHGCARPKDRFFHQGQRVSTRHTTTQAPAASHAAKASRTVSGDEVTQPAVRQMATRPLEPPLTHDTGSSLSPRRSLRRAAIAAPSAGGTGCAWPAAAPTRAPASRARTGIAR